jgi:3-oxoacyl-[acyl-carrier-protein] synthase II
MGERRVVITGLGPVTPIGTGAAAFHEAQLAGVSGVGPLSRFEASGLPVRIAAEVAVDPAGLGDRAALRRLDRVAILGLAASALAVEDAGLGDLLDGNGDRTRWGSAVGTALGGMESLEQAGDRARERGLARVDPFLLPKMIGNAVSAQVAMRYGLRGPMLSPSTACATGTDALGEAFRAVRNGEADVMLAGGAEAPLTPLLLSALSGMGALSRRNDEPGCASRPFDRERDGFVLGEGAAVLVLESLTHAERRGARIYAELLGYGRSSDAHHVTQPDPSGRGAALAMRRALDEARLEPDDVDHVNAHATSTPLGDAAEATAIGRVFHDRTAGLLVSATKSMTGHLIAASGAAEAIATVQALVSGVVPPTINHARSDDGFALDLVTHAPREAPLRRALSNSFGFGGNNAALVFARL